MARLGREAGSSGGAQDGAAARLFAGPGAARAAARSVDWTSTHLGAVAGWPQSLKTAVDLCLGSSFATALLWGPELVLIHNDAHIAILRDRFPGAMGRPAREVLGDTWSILGPLVSGALGTSESTSAPARAAAPVELTVRLDRGGAPRLAYLTASFAAVRDESGHSAGVMITATDRTARLRADDALRASEARQAFLLRLADALRWPADAIDIEAEAARILGEHIGAAWACYGTLDGAYEQGADDPPTHLSIRRCYATRGAADLAGTHPIGSSGFLDELRSGLVIATDDMGTSPIVDDGTYERFASLGMRSILAAPIVKRGVLYACVIVADTAERAWSDVEVNLVQEVADRTWAAVERARAETMLRETRQRLDDTLFTASMAYWDWDPATDTLVGSASMDELFGLVPGERFGSSAQAMALVHPDDRERHRELVRQAVAHGEGWHTERRIVRPRDGAVIWIEERATGTCDPVTGTLHPTGLVWDITDRKRAEAAADLERRIRERDALRRELTDAEEAERRRLARELHDQLGQQLTGLALGLADAERLARADEAIPQDDLSALLQRLERLKGLAREMTAAARYVALELRPPELDDMGFEDALRTYAGEWSVRFGVAAETVIIGETRLVLPPDASSALYRIAQEALTNVAKHARATAVSVILEKAHDQARLIVEDNGRGFQVDASTQRARRERRLGLAGIRERAALLGGSVKLESSPRRGTSLFVTLPLGRVPGGLLRETT